MPPAFATIQAEVDLGAHLPLEFAPPDCPPIPIGGSGLADGKVIFVYKNSASARQVLEGLRQIEEGGDDDERLFVAVVVEGADTREVDALRNELELQVPLHPGSRRRADAARRGTAVPDDADRRWPRDRQGVEMGAAYKDRERLRGGRRVATMPLLLESTIGVASIAFADLIDIVRCDPGLTVSVPTLFAHQVHFTPKNASVASSARVLELVNSPVTVTISAVNGEYSPFDGIKIGERQGLTRQRTAPDQSISTLVRRDRRGGQHHGVKDKDGQSIYSPDK